MFPKCLIRVLVVDDHDAVRDGICTLLRQTELVDVVGVAESGELAIARSVDHQPDIVVMDLRINGKNGVFATAQIIRHCPDTKVVAWSGFEDISSVKAAVSAGAKGYVLKKSPVSTLLASVRTVHRGGRYLDPNLSGAVLEEVWPVQPVSFRAENVLSARELEVLVLVAAGYTNSEIASQFGIKTKSVEYYRARLADKLDLHGRHQIVRYAVQHRLLDFESFDGSPEDILAKEASRMRRKKLPQRVTTLGLSPVEVQRGNP